MLMVGEYGHFDARSSVDEDIVVGADGLDIADDLLKALPRLPLATSESGSVLNLLNWLPL